MKSSIITFVLGAVLAAGIVYLVMNRDQGAAPDAGTPAAQQTASPATTPDVAEPAAAQPAPTVVEPSRIQPPRTRPSRPSAPGRSQPASTPPAAREQPPSTPESATSAQSPPAPVTSAPVSSAPLPGLPPPPEPATIVENKPDPPQPKTVTIPAGTLLTVRLEEALSTDRQQSGDSFRASLDQPLVIDGFVIAERGARVEGRVVESDAGGRVRGTSSMTLELVRLNTSDGQRVRLQTENFAKQAERTRGKDAAKIGAAAGIGAAIGAIAGGGRGAAIGAAAGGAAGTGGVMATRGGPAQLPAETRVSFRLREPITITEKLN